ncbi:MAG TPA: TIGR01777 family oxidoreductase [Acidimicrobiales bacterium]|nr:TIGR01777 family oxidoreductase [Acidimicrobiales bacterium]
MNVLLAGSSGLIGSALVERLGSEGHQCVRLVRPGGTPPGAAAATTVRWDPRQGTVDRAALVDAGPYDAVVNLAGAGIGDRRWTAGRQREILTSRVAATELVVSTITGLDPHPPVLVNASAIGVYGDRGDEVLTEQSGPSSGFLADVCRAWEATAEPAAAAGIRTVLLRSAVVLSARGGLLGRALLPFRLGLGARLGSGRQWFSWISLDDELSVVLAALGDPDLSGPVNAAAPTPITNAEFTAALAGALHRPAVLSVPVPVLDVAFGREMAREFVLASQRVTPARLLEVGHRFAHPTVDEALTAALAAR